MSRLAKLVALKTGKRLTRFTPFQNDVALFNGYFEGLESIGKTDFALYIVIC